MAPPRVLYVVLSSARTADRARAVLATWRQRLPEESHLAFAGDDALADTLGTDAIVWPCVEADRPRKLLEALRRARSGPAWDVLVRVDDDTFVLPDRIDALLSGLPLHEPFFAGGDLLASDRGDFFVGGAGYLCTRSALETAWPRLEELLDQPGAEDVLFAAAMHAADVRPVPFPGLFRPRRDPLHLFFGAAATCCGIDAFEQRFFQRLADERSALPFEITRCEVGWGDLGLRGWLGFDHLSVQIEGQRHTRAISAHGPSEVELRGPPGLLLELEGVLNDSASPDDEPDANFTVRDRKGAILVDLGWASVGEPARLVRVRFPEDGILVLRAATVNVASCHSVWLWNAPEWEPPQR